MTQNAEYLSIKRLKTGCTHPCPAPRINMSASSPFSFIIDDTLDEFFKFSSDLNISVPISNSTGNYNKTTTEGQMVGVFNTRKA